MKRLLLAAFIVAFSICGQAQHTLPTLDRNNAWTGTNTDSALHTFNAKVLVADGTVTNSTVSNPAAWVTRTDNSAPLSGAGILNPYLAPMVRLDLLTQSGGVTGSHQALLINMPNVKGKTYTTLTQGVTSSGSPQSVTVADSSVFSVNDVATIDLNQGSAKTENVTVSAIADGTHITAIFTKNHSNGALAFVAGKGDKVALGVAVADQAGNTNSLFAFNFNVICSSVLTVSCEDGEIDLTNSTGLESVDYYGSTAGPFFPGILLNNAGANNASVGIDISSNTAASQWRNGINIQAAKNYGIAITNSGSGAGAVTNGIAVQSAATNGVIIGANQTAATNPNFSTSDPTNAIYLTARTKAEGTTNATSGAIKFESIASSVTHVHQLHFSQAGGGLYFLQDAVAEGAGTAAFVGTDEAFNTPVTFRLRNSSGTQIGQFQNSSGAAVMTSDVYQTNGTVAGAGAIRLQNLGVLNFRNNANNADVNGISKNSSDVVAVGGSAGVSASGTITAPTYATTTNCASAAGTCVAAPAGRVTIAAAASTVTVATTAVTANSEIFIQEDATLGTALSVTCNTTTGRTYTVTTRTAGTSFVITSSAAPTTNPACLSFRILN